MLSIRKTYGLALLSILIQFSYCAKDEPNLIDEVLFPDCAVVTYTDWEALARPSDNSLTDVDFLSDTQGIVSGTAATLAKTEDGGQTWQSLHFNIAQTINQVSMVDENTFYAIRRGLFKTTDGGQTFTENSVYGSTGGIILSFHFFDPGHGIINEFGELYHTEDGGASWSFISEAGEQMQLMQFVSDSIGFMAGGFTGSGTVGGRISWGSMQKTLDGGKSWQQIQDVPLQIRTMSFLDDRIGYITNIDNEVYKTEDGGANFQLTASLPTSALFIDLVFVDECQGFAVGQDGIYQTRNGGFTWTLDLPGDGSFAHKAITKTPGNDLYVVGRNGKVLRKMAN